MTKLEEIKARFNDTVKFLVDIPAQHQETAKANYNMVDEYLEDIAWLIEVIEDRTKDIQHYEAKLQRQDEMLKVLADALEKYKLGRCFSVDGMLTTRFAKDALTKLKEMRGLDSE